MHASDTGASASNNRRAAFLLPAAIAAQFLLMLGFVSWNYCDARLETLEIPQVLLFRPPETTLSVSLRDGLARMFSVLIWLAILIGLFSLSAVFWAGKGYRSLRYAGVLSVVLALWLSIFSQWSTIAWQGHQARAAAIADELRPLARQLTKDWPRYDGENKQLGPFMAYPSGKPRTLILLKPIPIGHQFGSLAAIDRGSDGQLRFELSRGTDSMWLEWSAHGAPTQTNFTNGIGSVYRRGETISVDSNWRVSRFD
ncbi:MAG: hypothetical protein Aurels2KO_38020 [Aureliella sp.]